jgi:hypothetical protein
LDRICFGFNDDERGFVSREEESDDDHTNLGEIEWKKEEDESDQKSTTVMKKTFDRSKDRRWASDELKSTEEMTDAS